ncbi:hypothetical protein CRV24_003896 [Beauveria bassiana]|nr:hypothetical protein CRV24_003896 [Beauveria bassiana]
MPAYPCCNSYRLAANGAACTYIYSISHRIPYRHLLASSCQLLLLAQHLHPKYPGVAFKFHPHHHLTFHPSNPFFIDASLFSPRKIIVDATAHSVPCCQGYNCSGTSTSLSWALSPTMRANRVYNASPTTALPYGCQLNVQHPIRQSKRIFDPRLICLARAAALGRLRLRLQNPSQIMLIRLLSCLQNLINGFSELTASPIRLAGRECALIRCIAVVACCTSGDGRITA